MSTNQARQLRKNLTDAERRLWKHLRSRQIDSYKFRRQQPIGSYIVDFACFEKRLVIEVDGGQHSQQAGYDDTRTEWLESQGFRVLRFWNNQVLQEIEAVKSAIWEALESRKPLDEETPSPSMGEGRDGGERS
jgi:very-short-patch-repair endonuclease